MAVATAALVASTVGAPPSVGTWVPLGAGLALTIVTVAGVASPRWQLFGKATLRGRHPHAVALTFDDGPDPASTPQLLELLDDNGIRATFFVLLDRARQHPELVRAMADKHEIGLHGLAHDTSLVWMAPGHGQQALQAGVSELSAMVGAPVQLFRPPFGVTGPRLMASVQGAGLHTVWCSIRTYDGVQTTPAAIARRCEHAAAGDIVLMHEGRAPTLAALPQILDGIRDRGLDCVTVSELVA